MAVVYNELVSTSPSVTTVRASESTLNRRIHGVDTRDTLRNLSRALTPQRHSEDTDLSYKEVDPEIGAMIANLHELDMRLEVPHEKDSEASGLFDTGRDEPVEDSILSDEGSGYEDEDQSEELEDDDLEGEEEDSSEGRSGYADEDDSNDKGVSRLVEEDEDDNDGYIAEEGKNYSYIDINSIQDKDEGVEEDEEGKEHYDTGLNDDYDDVREAVKSPGSRAPYHRPDDLASIISHERNPTADEVYRLEERHHELEEALMADGIDIKHEQDDGSNGEQLKESGPSLEDLKEHAAAVGITPGVVVVDLEKLDKLLSTGEIDNSALLFMPDHAPTPASESPSPLESYKDSILSRAGSSPQRPTDIRLPSFGVKRDSIPTPTNPNPPAVIQTPGGKHIEFADGSTVFEAPFLKTLNYFKSHTGKENSPNKLSPNKARRNASLPEEIAELAREARVGEFDEMGVMMEKGEEDLRNYRFEDLAPIDPVLRSEIAGDLDVASRSPIAHLNEQKIVWPGRSAEQLMVQDSSDAEIRTYKLEIPGHYGDVFSMEVETNGSWTQIAELIRQRGKELDASVEDIDMSVRVSCCIINGIRVVLTVAELPPKSRALCCSRLETGGE
jgi:hypothetical protein